jgi:hypothetical protein
LPPPEAEKPKNEVITASPYEADNKQLKDSLQQLFLLQDKKEKMVKKTDQKYDMKKIYQH